MARVKITLTCTDCGNTFEHIHFCRNSREAASYEAWATENITVCPDCLRKAKQEKEAKKINAEATELELPDLTGTEKQVAWAKKIRHDLLAEAKSYRYTVEWMRHVIATGKVDELFSTIKATAETHPRNSKLVQAVYKAVTEPSAKWWIENR